MSKFKIEMIIRRFQLGDTIDSLASVSQLTSSEVLDIIYSHVKCEYYKCHMNGTASLKYLNLMRDMEIKLFSHGIVTISKLESKLSESDILSDFTKKEVDSLKSSIPVFKRYFKGKCPQPHIDDIYNLRLPVHVYMILFNNDIVTMNQLKDIIKNNKLNEYDGVDNGVENTINYALKYEKICTKSRRDDFHKDKNDKISMLYKSGISADEIGKKYLLSRSRIYQIVAKNNRKELYWYGAKGQTPLSKLDLDSGILRRLYRSNIYSVEDLKKFLMVILYPHNVLKFEANNYLKDSDIKKLVDVVMNNCKGENTNG